MLFRSDEVPPDWCPHPRKTAADGVADCLLGDPTAARPTFAFLGDSHAWAMAPGLSTLAAEAGVQGIYLGRVGCPPLLDVDRATGPCAAALDASLARIRALDVPEVILVARWAIYATGHDYGRHPWALYPLVRKGRTIPEDERDAAVAAALSGTLDEIGRAHV